MPTQGLPPHSGPSLVLTASGEGALTRALPQTLPPCLAGSHFGAGPRFPVFPRSGSCGHREEQLELLSCRAELGGAGRCGYNPAALMNGGEGRGHQLPWGDRGGHPEWVPGKASGQKLLLPGPGGCGWSQINTIASPGQVSWAGFPGWRCSPAPSGGHLHKGGAGGLHWTPPLPGWVTRGY